MATEFDPLEAKQLADPYSIYCELRDEAPCYRAASGVWTVSRYDDVLRILKTPEDFSSKAMVSVLLDAARGDSDGGISLAGLWFMARTWWKLRMSPTAILWSRVMIGEDGKSHRRLRTVVNRAFTPQRIAAQEPRIRELVASCLSGLEQGRDFDLVRDLAVPLPVTIIAELLGVDPSRREEFKDWSRHAIDLISGPGRTAELEEEGGVGAVIEMMAYLRSCARERRKHPRDDLISALVTSKSGDEVLKDSEVIMFAILLLLAGNETTTNLIGNAVVALLQNRDQLALVEADPSQIPAALEEALRFDGPIQTVFRETTREVEVAGTHIPKGETVGVLIGSANRDERRFDMPDRYDIRRDTQGHVAFGFGPHFCLGASLARLEARIALEGLLPQLACLELSSHAISRQDSFLVRGPMQLELARRTTAAAAL